MERTILFQSNNLADFSKEEIAIRRNFSQKEIVKMIRSCTNKCENYDIDIDTKKLQDIFFPTPHRMIFISHLSSDSKKAHEIKEIIEANNPKYACFIDSDLWGNVYKIQELLQHDFAYREWAKTYNLTTVNNIAKHLYLVLGMALTRAIKASPFFLFVPHTEQEALGSELITDSPWVSHELLVSSFCKEKTEVLVETIGFSKAASRINFKHTADTSHLQLSTLAEFIELIKKF